MFQQLTDSLVHSFAPSFPILRSPARADERATPSERASSRAGSIIKRREGAPFAAKRRRRRRHCFHFERADGRTDGLRRKSCASVTDSGRTNSRGRWGRQAGAGCMLARSVGGKEGMTPSGTTTAPAPSGTPSAGVRDPLEALKTSSFIIHMFVATE